MPAPKHSKALISNAIAAAQAAGLTLTAIVIGPDGSLTISVSSPEMNPPANQQNDQPDTKAPRKFGQKR